MTDTATISTDAPTCAVTVLYDGACPLCRAEISHYQGIAPETAVGFADVASDPTAATRQGLTQSEALARFHVVADGKLLSGAAAFAALWRALPGFWGVLGRIAGLPGIVHVLELGYRGFLRIRPFVQRLASSTG